MRPRSGLATHFASSTGDRFRRAGVRGGRYPIARQRPAMTTSVATRDRSARIRARSASGARRHADFVTSGALQLSLFDSKELAEVGSPDSPQGIARGMPQPVSARGACAQAEGSARSHGSCTPREDQDRLEGRSPGKQRSAGSMRSGQACPRARSRPRISVVARAFRFMKSARPIHHQRGSGCAPPLTLHARLPRGVAQATGSRFDDHDQRGRRGVWKASARRSPSAQARHSPGEMPRMLVNS